MIGASQFTGDSGPQPAIEWEAVQFRRRTGISCAVQVPDDPIGISGDQKIAMFRICQEALTNIVRHSQAKNVLVTLVGERDYVILTISDDGIGFSVDSLEHTTALGILGMRERALLLDAPLHIESQPGIGTTITLRIPLDYAGSAATGDS